MSRKVLLVGHCGPDNSYLRMVVKQADPAAQILAADDDSQLSSALADRVDLVLFNRELGYGFDPSDGVEMTRRVKALKPDLRVMLVSNYPEAQRAAEQAGALPGFGKREIGTPRVAELLRSALA